MTPGLIDEKTRHMGDHLSAPVLDLDSVSKIYF